MTLLVEKIRNAGYCVMGRWFFTAVCLRLAFSCCKVTALFDLSLYHRGKKKILKYSDDIMIYHYITGGKKKILKYSDDIMIYHYITGGRRKFLNILMIS